LSSRSPAISIPTLRAELNGQVLAPGDDGYDQARTIFYGGFDQRPQVIIRPADDAEVARVVALARDSGLELAVAGMLILLGVLRLRDAARGLATVPAAHLVADHEHGGQGVVHSHPHVHGADHAHEHPHVHPSRWLASLGWRSGWPAGRALLVGAVHGLAGSAAVSLLVLATLRSTASAVAYLLIFGVGTIIGMTLLTAVMAYPVALALRFRRARQALAICAGIGSIVFGLAYGYHVL